MRTNTTTNYRSSVAFVLVAMLYINLFANLGVRARAASPAAGPNNLKSSSQLNSEAALYDTAIREIGRIANLRMVTPDDSKAAQAILDKQIPSLRFSRSKLVVSVMNDSSFISSVRPKASDKASADQFAKELSKDPKSILSLGGAQASADRIRNSVEADLAMLRKVAAQMKQAGIDLKAKARTEHAARVTGPIANESPSLSLPETLGSDTITILVVAAAVIVFPPLAIAVFALADLAATAGLAIDLAAVAGLAVVLVARLISNLSSDEGSDRIANCQKGVDTVYRNCAAAGTKLPFPLNLAAADGCYAQWLLDSAGCLVTP